MKIRYRHSCRTSIMPTDNLVAVPRKLHHHSLQQINLGRRFMDASSSDKPTIAEAYLSALHKFGIKFVFANGGTDFAPIVEGLLRSGERGSELPGFVTVPHENVAMSMA